MIRRTVDADWPEILRMMHAFHAVCPYAESVTFKDGDFKAFCAELGASGDGAVFVAEGANGLVGIVGGHSGPCFFNFGSVAAMEMFIWSEAPGTGTKLIKALEGWARDKGCFSLAFVSQHGMRDAGPLYERLGYERNETSYLKVF